MKPEMLAAPDKATVSCPSCGTTLHAPYPAWEIGNMPDASVIIAVHKDDASCITCPMCDAYLLPAVTGAQVQWTWVPGTRPTAIIKPPLSLIKQ